MYMNMYIQANKTKVFHYLNYGKKEWPFHTRTPDINSVSEKLTNCGENYFNIQESESGSRIRNCN